MGARVGTLSQEMSCRDQIAVEGFVFFTRALDQRVGIVHTRAEKVSRKPLSYFWALD